MPHKPDERTASPTRWPTTARLPEAAASVGVYAKVASLLHDARREAPDGLGVFLRRNVAAFGMRDVSVYVTDFEQRRLVPIGGSAATTSLDIDASPGGLSFTSVSQVEERVAAGVRLWSVVVDGAARLGVISVTTATIDDESRALANSLAGVVAALLVTRGQCTDAYTEIRRSQKFSLAAEMQWDLLPPLSLDSDRVSVAGLIQPAYEVGGDSFDYAVNGDTLDFAVFDAMGHGLQSSQLAHLAVNSYRHSRRSGLDLEATYQAMDATIAARGRGEEFVTCVIGRLDLEGGNLSWINVAHPLPLLVRGDEFIGRLACKATLPAGLGHGVAGGGPLGDGVAEIAHEVLRAGDRVFCITDGLVDSHRPGGQDFGERRLVDLLDDRSRRGVDAAETVRQLSHNVLDHHGELSDDTTAFLVDFHGARPPEAGVPIG
ncbi:MAG TPA: PP2C family protein-serine/threonine phosphatase [Acidimicrobiales bacterium]|nr:PP2C family protein-serine/threonine phosphatase [Acidimicrobiales bacterium]